jgi:hypothetical protein
MRWLGWSTAGLLALLLGLLVSAPAAWWDVALARASRGSLLLAPESGTFWQGSGSLQALLPEGRVATLARVSWRFDFSNWYRARLGLAMLDSANANPLLVAHVSPAGVEIEALHLGLPMSWLGHYSAMVRDAGLSGQLTLSSQQLRFERIGQHLAGEAELVWLGAGTRLLPGKALGDYRLGLSLADQDLKLALTTLSGAVNLQGDGLWRIGQRPRLNFVARPAPELAKSLEPMLRMLGRDQGDGSYRIVPML